MVWSCIKPEAIGVSAQISEPDLVFQVASIKLALTTQLGVLDSRVPAGRVCLKRIEATLPADKLISVLDPNNQRFYVFFLILIKIFMQTACLKQIMIVLLINCQVSKDSKKRMSNVVCRNVEPPPSTPPPPPGRVSKKQDRAILLK